MKFPVFSVLNREFGFRDEFARDCPLQQRVRNELLSTRHEPPARISSTASHPLLERALAWAFNPEIAQERVVPSDD
jgi:hypothetical protein